MSDEPAAVAAARILVVDDEEAVRLSVVRILERFGYTVLSATDGSEALTLASGDDAIDLIIMDVTMPVMDGPAAACALRERGVDVPIVLMSGYAEEELMDRGVMTHVDGFIKKPFEVIELVSTVRERLVKVESGL